MKGKIISIILTTILLTLTSSVYAFSDTEKHWAKDAIFKLNKAEFIKGYENNEFKPDNYITRAEVATILNRMNGSTKESQKYIPDIKRDDWYYSEIRKAVQSGIMQGDENGYINPKSYITREEAVVMLARAFMIDDSATTSNSFKDENEVSIWAQKKVDTFVNFNYINGYENNKICPKANITRAELATIITRIFTKIATTGIYEDNVSGNMIVTGNNVVLNNIVINGNLIISEGTKETITINDVEVKGDLILREEINTDEIFCMGRRLLLYLKDNDTVSEYYNNEFGIKFSISNNVDVIEKWNTNKIDYKKEDLIIIDIIKSDEYYLKCIDTIGNIEIKKVDNLYGICEKGEMRNAEYILYNDNHKNAQNYLLVIKRDNIIYTIVFNNIVTKNLVDNVIGTLNLFETESVIDRENIIYKNNKLNLKFSYKEGYVGVDDSYNTNNVYSGDAPLKLFIQVNSITDLQDYSFEEVIYLLKTLEKDEGELINTEKLKISNKNAVKFKISSDEKLINSLYIIDGNILYNFNFRADIDVMNEIGEDLFDEIIRSIEI